MIYICQKCEATYDSINDEYPPDQVKDGYWCECEFFNYFDSTKKRPPYILFLETSKNQESVIKQKPKIKLKKQLSPLRYPGGKGKIADRLLLSMRPEQLETLISVFAGGASVELALLEAKQIKNLILNDLDYGIFSLFTLIKYQPEDLIQRLKSSDPNHDDFFINREIIKNDYKGMDVMDAAWAMLIVNRLAYSGIYSANPLGGRKGTKEQLLSRFNRDALCKRITQIHQMSERIQVHQQNAVEFIEEHMWHDHSTIYIDPPYYQQGHALYRHFYTEERHIEVAELIDSIYEEFPNVDFIVTYDNHSFIRDLYYKYATQIELNRRYSV
ncbi:hypothetical protein ASD24_29680 [Paenibacillus sp. Root52]|uniref:DNA adenine methylase n=1 Tax=Paenibacillus sp. Root52 TaxID=1736552 RepID=UPI0006FB8F9D|nr:DNA adenine methylase [Paenibacillus sp. Root52]KQY83610.1 hypothetical protein ASD24_29680 [Paenibacillus sp. Root52]